MVSKDVNDQCFVEKNRCTNVPECAIHVQFVSRPRRVWEDAESADVLGRQQRCVEFELGWESSIVNDLAAVMNNEWSLRDDLKQRNLVAALHTKSGSCNPERLIFEV